MSRYLAVALFLLCGTVAGCQIPPSSAGNGATAKDPTDILIGQMQAKFPQARFARWRNPGEDIVFNADLSRSHVRSIRFAKSETSDTTLRASVWLTGNQSQPTAPTVFVTLYDVQGKVLTRTGVVDYLNKELKPGETDRVEDVMEIPPGIAPAIVAIDEDKDVGPEP